MEDYIFYQNFTEEDFIADPWFREWVLHPNEVSSSFWQRFFNEYPQKVETAEISALFLKGISFKEDFPSANLIKTSYRKHLNSIEKTEKAKILTISKKGNLVPFIWIAASIAGLIITFLGLLFFQGKEVPVVVKTDFGKMKNITLPDSSHVVLNANSSIKFSNEWKQGNKREVWLEGEAFFDVRHLNTDKKNITNGDRFIVHANDIIIEVLGTSFDVRIRRGKTEVVLEKGQIVITFKDDKRKNLLMKPGDFVSYNYKKNELITSHTIAKNYSAWRIEKLILNDPKVSEIVSYLEDNFGCSIKIEGYGLAEKRIEGPILLTNLDDALFILSTVLNTQIIRKDSAIIMRAR